MCLEEKRRNDAEIAASAAHRPKQIGVLLGICRDKASVGENHVHRKEIIDRKTTLSR
jgi:hypothetical protein